MTAAALACAIARRINQEQYMGGRLAAIGNAGHPATIAEIVTDELVQRDVIDEGRQRLLKLPLENGT